MSDDSNGQYGDHHDTEHPTRTALYDTFKSYGEIPDDPPEVVARWLEEKGLTVADLHAFNVRFTIDKSNFALCYLFPDGIKYRTLNDPPKRWTTPGDWSHALFVRRTQPAGVIVAEGETDTMQLARHYPAWDIACVPAGAKHISDQLIQSLDTYTTVLVALDDDEAGNIGADRIIEALPRTALRMVPPLNDWCTTASHQPLESDPYVYVRRTKIPVYTLAEIVATDFGSYAENNWFAQDILPVSGQCIIHAPIKSLKSVIMFDMCRAIATGTTFAGPGGYEFLHPEGPAKVLLFQMEIRPEAFQRRVLGTLADMPEDEREAFLTNLLTYKIGDRELPRLKVQQKDFRSTILRAIDEVEPKVLAFDPLQRLTGDADIDKVNELDKLLDFFAELQNQGFTVISCHHNNKASGPAAKSPTAMAGSQRFGADADSICTVTYDPKTMGDDENTQQIKRRNFDWTLRNGAATGRGIEASPDPVNPAIMRVRFQHKFTMADAMLDEPGVTGAPSVI